jgi:hypothetical protein
MGNKCIFCYDHSVLITAKGAVLIWYVGCLLYSSRNNFVHKILTDVKVGHCLLLLPFTPISCFRFFRKCTYPDVFQCVGSLISVRI